MQKPPKVILASQSPRRQQLLSWAEVPFEVIVSHTSETIPAGMKVESVPEYLAREKAAVVRASLKDSQQDLPIVAADTIVVYDGNIIGKPQDASEAKKFLGILSGNKHRVITGVCIVHHSSEICFSETTTVQFHELSESQIDFYVENYKPYDKAGAYAIQEWIGVIGIKGIEGNFFNVMGLPVSRVYEALLSL